MIWGYASRLLEWLEQCLDDISLTLDSIGIGDLAILDRNVEVSPHHYLGGRVEMLGKERKCGFLHMK